MSVVNTLKKSNGTQWLGISSVAIALLLMLPILIIIGFIFSGSVDVEDWQHQQQSDGHRADT